MFKISFSSQCVPSPHVKKSSTDTVYMNHFSPVFTYFFYFLKLFLLFFSIFSFFFLRPTYDLLISWGYTVEILRSPWTCFDAREYHALLVVDPEEAFGTGEVEKLTTDIRWVM